MEEKKKENKNDQVFIEKERKIAPESLRTKAGFAKTHGRPSPDPIGP
ncbi:hypothetical protein [Paenibacillus campi]|nr:hypothetical protein [Paenibacillus sp. SGZ-1014]